jgi:hypothetical protein
LKSLRDEKSTKKREGNKKTDAETDRESGTETYRE